MGGGPNGERVPVDATGAAPIFLRTRIKLFA
jgi:hypothetical protein